MTNTSIGIGSADSLDTAIAEARRKAAGNAVERIRAADNMADGGYRYMVSIHRTSGDHRLRYNGDIEGPTSITEQTAFDILIRMVGLASRCALGDGLDRETVAKVLEDEAYAIRTQDVAEDMSPILFHHA